MSRTDDRGGVPRAMVHRRILDVAAADGDASMEVIADRVSGASVDLVERVLDEYGDPADGADEQGTDATPSTGEASAQGADSEPSVPAEPPADVPDTAESESGMETNASDPVEPTMSQNGPEATELSTNGEAEPLPEWSDISEKQRATLRAVAEDPDAPQEAIADRLGVTRATVSRRLNDVPGFEWEDRAAFVRSLLGDGDDEATEDGGPSKSREAVSDLERRVAALENDREGHKSRENRDSPAEADPSVPPELAHRVVHACMESDRISEEEELQLLRAFM